MPRNPESGSSNNGPEQESPEYKKEAGIFDSEGGIEHKDGWTWWNVLSTTEESSAKSWAKGAEQALRSGGIIPSGEITNITVREVPGREYAGRFIVVLGDASTSQYEDTTIKCAEKIVEEIREKEERGE